MKICLSEGGIGWIAPLLQRADQVWKKQRFWASRNTFQLGNVVQEELAENSVRTLDIDGRTPTQQFLDQVYGRFIEDEVGVKAMRDLGALANVMVETDYPHSDSTWPDCITIAREQVAFLDDADQFAVLRGNAERVFDFKPAEPPILAG
jgi:hypothetical protein